MIKYEKQKFGLPRCKWPDIALIGSFPPPYGGISVHLQRLTKRLDDDGFEYILYNTLSASERLDRVVSVCRNKMWWYLKFCLQNRSKISHLYSPIWLGRLVFAISARFRPGKYILSIHGRSISVSLQNPRSIRGRLSVWLLNQMDAIICCNEYIKSECIDAIGLPSKKVYMIPAYIPPAADEIKTPPEPLLKYIRSHSPVLCATAWIGQRYMGDDIYGVDMLIRLIEFLLPDFPNIGLVLSVNGGESEYVINQTVKYSKKKVGEHILFLTEPLDEIVGLYRECDLFCRPTNTDGDAISIRESLHVGTPVVASDVVLRPEPCILFQSRKMNQFELAVRDAIRNLEAHRSKIQFLNFSDNAEKIIDLYKKLLADEKL